MCKPQGDFQNFLLRPVQGNAVSFCGHDTAKCGKQTIILLISYLSGIIKLNKKKRVKRRGNKN